MVEPDAPTLDRIFHALGDNTRRSMLGELAAGERTISQLAEPFRMSLAAASKHVKVLERAGLVRRKIDGRTHRCNLEPAPLASAEDWIAMFRRFQIEQVDLLEQILRDEAFPPLPER